MCPIESYLCTCWCLRPLTRPPAFLRNTSDGALQVKWLAFEDAVDWNSIAIIVHRDQMATIPALVAAADAEVRPAGAGAGRAGTLSFPLCVLFPLCSCRKQAFPFNDLIT